MKRHLHIGGLIAAGFDESGKFLLTVSHAGRGVFCTTTWERVARDSRLSYPIDGYAIGIGPIDGLSISVTAMDPETGELRFTSPDGDESFEYDSGCLSVITHDAGE